MHDTNLQNELVFRSSLAQFSASRRGRVSRVFEGHTQSQPQSPSTSPAAATRAQPDQVLSVRTKIVAYSNNNSISQSLLGWHRGIPEEPTNWKHI